MGLDPVEPGPLKAKVEKKAAAPSISVFPSIVMVSTWHYWNEETDRLMKQTRHNFMQVYTRSGKRTNDRSTACSDKSNGGHVDMGRAYIVQNTCIVVEGRLKDLQEEMEEKQGCCRTSG